MNEYVLTVVNELVGELADSNPNGDSIVIETLFDGLDNQTEISNDKMMKRFPKLTFPKMANRDGEREADIDHHNDDYDDDYDGNYKRDYNSQSSSDNDKSHEKSGVTVDSCGFVNTTARVTILIVGRPETSSLISSTLTNETLLFGELNEIMSSNCSSCCAKMETTKFLLAPILIGE